MKILVTGLSPADTLNSAAMRTNALVKGLLECGNEVDYLTRQANVNEIKAGFDWFGRLRMYYIGDSESYNTIKSEVKKNLLKKSFYKIIHNIYHLFFIYDHTFFIIKQMNVELLPQNQYDLIISSSDPKTSHLCVRRLLARGVKCDKWVQYWGDPMAADITRKTLYPRFVIKRFEKKILKEADKIIYVSPFTCEMQKKIFPQLTDKMDWLPIPYWSEKVYPETENDSFTVGYFGDYKSKIRNIIPFYHVCKALPSLIKSYIIGSSDIQLPELENIEILSRRDVTEYEKQSDLLVCILNKNGTQIPGKLYHYAATSKPILVIVDGEKKEQMMEYIGKFERFYLCDNTEAEIEKALLNIMQSNKKFEPCKQLTPYNISRRFLSKIQ